MAVSFWAKDHFSPIDMKSDVVIVGAGFVGLSTAFWLSEMAPDLKVIVLERKQIGDGASGKNAGFLTAGSAVFYHSLVKKWGVKKALAVRSFADESRRLTLKHLLGSLEKKIYAPTSSLTFFHESSAALDLQKDFHPEQFNFHWLSQKDLPFPEAFIGAYESFEEYKVHPIELLSGLRDILKKRQVKVLEGTSAFELLADGIRTDGLRIQAEKLVLAMNGYLPQFDSHFSSVIFPKRAQMLAVELEDDLRAPHLYYDPSERVYWRKESEKVLVIGGKRLLDESGEVGVFEKISPLVQNGLEEYLRRKLKLNYKVLYRWSGIMGFTEHELPFVGALKAKIETYLVGGFSGHGMGLGFHSGREAAELVLGYKKESFFDQFKKSELTL